MVPGPSAKRTSVLAFGLAALSGTLVGADRPCDIYKAGGTPCVAAHSTTRALYQEYTGPLYLLTRECDGSHLEIHPSEAGGVANVSAHDEHCKGTTCVISMIHDQSSSGNHLMQAPKGGAGLGPEALYFDSLAGASGAPVSVSGKNAYGVFIAPGTGYRSNVAKNTAKGDEPQGMYAVLDGTHYNGKCCFDYGNAETNNRNTGNGHMEAIYFGKGDGFGKGKGEGSGPWIMGDLENGLFPGRKMNKNKKNPTIDFRFVTAVVKGQPDNWAIRGGNAADGALSTYYNGQRPKKGYNPMSKEGAVILGIGGDNSNWAQGTFYEGAVTSGFPSDETDDKVQADIVTAKYQRVFVSELKIDTRNGSSVSLQITTPGFENFYLAHDGETVKMLEVTSSSDYSLKQRASWRVQQGRGEETCYSFESVDKPGHFIRHHEHWLKVDLNLNLKKDREDATFCSQPGLNGRGHTFRAWTYPARYIRHVLGRGYLASNGGPRDQDHKLSFSDDVSFILHNPGFA